MLLLAFSKSMQSIENSNKQPKDQAEIESTEDLQKSNTSTEFDQHNLDEKFKTLESASNSDENSQFSISDNFQRSENSKSSPNDILDSQKSLSSSYLNNDDENYSNNKSSNTRKETIDLEQNFNSKNDNANNIDESEIKDSANKNDSKNIFDNLDISIFANSSLDKICILKNFFENVKNSNYNIPSNIIEMCYKFKNAFEKNFCDLIDKYFFDSIINLKILSSNLQIQKISSLKSSIFESNITTEQCIVSIKFIKGNSDKGLYKIIKKNCRENSNVKMVRKTESNGHISKNYIGYYKIYKKIGRDDFINVKVKFCKNYNSNLIGQEQIILRFTLQEKVTLEFLKKWLIFLNLNNQQEAPSSYSQRKILPGSNPQQQKPAAKSHNAHFKVKFRSLNDNK